jgi:Zn-dependent protease
LASLTRYSRLLAFGSVAGVPIYVHSTGLLAAAVIGVAAHSWPALAVSIPAAFLAILLVHEFGHVFAARAVGCQVWSVEIYPALGLTRYAPPESARDACFIAWAGVLAQLGIAIPLALLRSHLLTQGVTVTNIVIHVLIVENAVIALLNLAPFPGLDGATAWRLLPALLPTRTHPKGRTW